MFRIKKLLLFIDHETISTQEESFRQDQPSSGNVFGVSNLELGRVFRIRRHRIGRQQSRGQGHGPRARRDGLAAGQNRNVLRVFQETSSGELKQKTY